MAAGINRGEGEPRCRRAPCPQRRGAFHHAPLSALISAVVTKPLSDEAVGVIRDLRNAAGLLLNFDFSFFFHLSVAVILGETCLQGEECQRKQ